MNLQQLQTTNLTKEELDLVNGTDNFTELEGRQLDSDYIHSKSEGGNKMASLKDEAIKYEPKTTLNIADLDKIPLSLELKDGSGETKEGKEFTYKYAVIDGKEYRVAGTIIGGIQAILGKMPNLEFVSVLRTGTGRDTKYQVIPYQEPTPPLTTAEAIAPAPQ